MLKNTSNLNGFRHFREDKYKVFITDLMEVDNE